MELLRLLFFCCIVPVIAAEDEETASLLQRISGDQKDGKWGGGLDFGGGGSFGVGGGATGSFGVGLDVAGGFEGGFESGAAVAGGLASSVAGGFEGGFESGAAVAGGVASSVAGGFEGGFESGAAVAGGVASSVAGGAAGAIGAGFDFAGGVAGGVAGGAAGAVGAAGGVAGGIAGGAAGAISAGLNVAGNVAGGAAAAMAFKYEIDVGYPGSNNAAVFPDSVDGKGKYYNGIESAHACANLAVKYGAEYFTFRTSDGRCWGKTSDVGKQANPGYISGLSSSSSSTPTTDDADCEGATPWKGTWYVGESSGPMELHLTTSDGIISGTGSDSSGEFTIKGTISSKKLEYDKAYSAYHVSYDGHYLESEGSYSGDWHIPQTKGYDASEGTFTMTPPHACIPKATDAPTLPPTAAPTNAENVYPPVQDPFAVCSTLNVCYGPAGMKKRQQMMADLYFPCGDAQEGGWDAIVGLHGVGGSRLSQKYLAEGFVQHGFMFVPIDWRVTGSFTDSRQFVDVQAAITFLYDESLTYNVGKIFLYGYSAGGLLCTSFILSENVQHLDAAVSAAGVNSAHMGLERENVKPVLFIGCDDDPEVPPKFAAKLVPKLMDKDVAAARTLYKTGCAHYPMSNGLFYHDVLRFFRDPLKYYSSADKATMPNGYWETISETAACQRNKEGIKPVTSIRMYNKESCKGLCLSPTDDITCVAIDYIGGNQKMCNLYEEACTNPTYGKKGSSSEKWVSDPDYQAPPLLQCSKKLCEEKVGQPWEKKCKARYCKGCDECSELA